MKKWQPNLSLLKEELQKVPLWVRFYGLPLEFLTATGLSYIASAIGKPLHADRMTSSKKRISYARICVEVDASKDFDLQCGNCSWTTVFVEYDWRPSVCSLCKVFGHSTASCALNPNPNSFKSDSVKPIPDAGPSSKQSAEEVFFDAQVVDDTVLNYLRLQSLLILICFMIGFTIWWVHLPDYINLTPMESLNPQWVDSVRETTAGVCSNKEMGDACQCSDQLHKKVAKILNEEIKDIKQDFDPLQLNKSRVGKARATTLAFLVVACVGFRTLSETAFEMACGVKLF